MKRFFSALAGLVLALLLMGAVETAQAAPFHAFCKGGVPSKEELVRRMEVAYAADHTGHTKLKDCQGDLIQFLVVFQQDDPTLTDVSQVAGYVRDNLERVTIDHTREYYSSCLRGKSSGTEDVIVKCQREYVGKDVQVFASKKTGRLMLKLDCANPGLSLVEQQHCDLFVFETRYDSEKRGHIPGYGPVTSDRCHGVRDLDKRAFEKGRIRFISEVREIKPGCIDRTPGCSYAGADRKAAPRPRTADGTADDLTPGLHAMLVDPAVSSNPDSGLGICVESIDPTTGVRQTSLVALAFSPDYQQMGQHGPRVARAYYTKAERPAGVVDDGPRDLYLYLQ